MTAEPRPNFHLEDAARKNVGEPNIVVVGIDEVGTGAWAGPIVAAAVALDSSIWWPVYNELDDSKRLSKTVRKRLEPEIWRIASFVGIGVVTTNEINIVGVGRAREIALERAYFHVLGQCQTPLVAVVDGRSMRKLRSVFGRDSIFADRADQKSLSVAAASIVAKVTRDNMMRILDAINPGYDFRNHVGYGTAKHRAALQLLGPCEIHRLSVRPVQECLAKFVELAASGGIITTRDE